MDTTSISLGDLLAPVPPERFFRESWEIEPLAICRDDAACYRGLFATRDLDALIAYGRPTFADSGAVAPVAQRPPTYVRGVLGEQAAAVLEQPDIAELRQMFQRGQSLVIMGMQRRWPAIAELCRNLEAVFHCPVHANLYLTPPGSQGFAAHFDTHEVFVLQLEGEKHWRLFGVAEELPLATDATPLSRKPGKPTQEITLRPGDLLYIPRGHVHEAATADIKSLHLTVGVNVYRWADLLRHALACASRQDVRFRKSIPGGALCGETPELKQQFQALVARLADWAESDGLFERAQQSLADQFFSHLRMLPCGQFAGAEGLEKLHLDSVVERNMLAICRVVEADQGVAIEFPGNRVGGPHRIASALRFVAGANRFAVRELPDDLTSEGKLVLVRRLIREGLLKISGQAISEFQLTGATLSEDNHASDSATGQLAETMGHARGQCLV